MFDFYALPILPVIVLAITMVAGLLLGRSGSKQIRADAAATTEAPPPVPSLDAALPIHRQIGAFAVGIYFTLVVANFFWLYPLFVGNPISNSAWHARIWFPGWI